jgi:lipoprotein Spr
VSKKAAPLANVHTKVDKADAPLPKKNDKKKAKDDKKEKKKAVAPIIKKEAEDTLAYLRKKYAPLLSTVQDSIQNLELYKVIDEWMGTPYKYGGQSKSGTDCSGFAGILYTNAFSVALARRVSEIHKTTPTLLKLEELKEGDLVFFDIGKRKLSHVGVYLTNGKFVHASTSQGVVISDLNMAYYKKYFRCGGRIIKS